MGQRNHLTSSIHDYGIYVTSQIHDYGIYLTSSAIMLMLIAPRSFLQSLVLHLGLAYRMSKKRASTESSND